MMSTIMKPDYGSLDPEISLHERGVRSRACHQGAGGMNQIVGNKRSGLVLGLAPRTVVLFWISREGRVFKSHSQDIENSRRRFNHG
jgi:hypothetical protein